MDSSVNVYITGSTNSDIRIATSGAYQTKLGGSIRGYNYDAYIAKFSSSGSRIWATYYGGAGDDRSRDIVVNKYGDPAITGTTRSSVPGIATRGAYQVKIGGSIIDFDIFVASFSATPKIHVLLVQL